MFLSFLLLTLAFLSLWVKRHPLIWGCLLSASLLLALFTNVLTWEALFFLAILFALWLRYTKKKEDLFFKIFLFVVLILYSISFKLHIIPGFNNLQITPKFFLNYDCCLVGFFPLALLVPLAQKGKDWKQVFTKGLFLSVFGIGILAFLAVLSGTVQLQAKLPSYALERYLNNFFLVAIPEEGFYRGFMQRELGNFFNKVPLGKYLALVLTALIFTAAHVFWSPDVGTFVFIFLAGLLYGYVYLATKKIESAILCHFLLNFTHMTFFTYHAM